MGEHGHRRARGSWSVAFAFAALIVLHAGGAAALDPSLDVSQYAHTAWKIRDGFPRGIVFAMAQAPDGYLWLGTELGLFRFDGVRAIPWQPAAGERLPGEQITSMLFARDGVLWIGTRSGVASLRDGKLTHYPEFAGQYALVLLEDRDGVVWLGGDAPGRMCAAREGRVVCEGAGTLGQGVVNAAYEDPRGNLWIAADEGVWRWRPGPPVAVSFPPGVTEVDDFVEADGALLVAASGGGLRRLEAGTIVRHPVPGIEETARPLDFLRSRDGSVWIGTLDGLLHLHGGRADRFGPADGLSGEIIQIIYEDREGNVWVSTGGGLDRFRAYAFPRISTAQGLSSASIFAVQATAGGDLWIAAANGLNRWRDGRVTYYRKRTLPPHPARRDVPLLDRNALALGLDARGRLLAASDALFTFEDEQFVRGLPLSRGVSAVADDGRGTTWVSVASEGLLSATAEGSRVFPWSQFGNEVATVVALLPDRERGVWLGPSAGGVVHFDAGRVLASYGPRDGLAPGRVSHLRYAEDHTIWAASAGGLSRIQDGRVRALTSADGLPCDVAHWSMEDDDRAVWLYTICGLVRIPRSEIDAWVEKPGTRIQAQRFDGSDGVRITSLSGGYSPRVTRSPDGKIWFATYEGLTWIDPRHLPRNDLPPPVHVEQVTADGKVYPAGAAGRRLRLPPRVHDLAIDYTALSLVAPEKVRFRIKLEGEDRAWRETVNDRQVQYTNLRPGDYRFLVTACNDSGVWNETGASLDFTIAAAFFETAWFRALAVAAALALLLSAYRIRVGLLQRRQRLLERHHAEITALNDRLLAAQDEERSRIAGELHDGVVQQLTTAHLLLGVAKRQIEAGSPAQQPIAESQQLLLGMGADIRQLSHELHPATLKEAGLPAALSTYCREFSKTRDLPVSCAAAEDVRELSSGTALALYRIAQEALGNVAKHARATRVDVQLSRVDGVVRLQVSDDGIGFVPGGAGATGGVGLVNMRERVRMLGGTLEIDSRPGGGTTVRAELPFRPA